ncbi:hypothetical protein CUJ84_pRLN1000716 (plasmid) [Rhizobium leguminosarum]|uniref:Uncharacterized protein n=1 Tax=Rhizobium leguminosarum TaxID=384 RepID=A0A2K9ZDQ1_RHILE|nr:hypothetical protein CUJ84_pRLN1000716 [Rhizobium leguminosarum]
MNGIVPPGNQACLLTPGNAYFCARVLQRNPRPGTKWMVDVFHFPLLTLTSALIITRRLTRFDPNNVPAEG